MKILIVANPVSGSGTAVSSARRLRNALKQAGHETELFITGSANEAETRAARCQETKVVVSAGGDGTIREIVNGIDLSDPPRLLVYPCGTGNVLAEELCMPRDVPGTVELIQRGLHRWIDVALCGQRRFLCMAGIGFDARVVHEFHQDRDRESGMCSYACKGVQVFMTHDERTVDVYVDGTRQAVDVPFVQVANTRNYGGPILFSPSARATDGRLDVSWLETRGKPALFRLMLSSFLGLPKINPDYHTVRGRHVRIKPRNANPVLQLDGDPEPNPSHTFSIQPRAVPFLTPLARGAGHAFKTGWEKSC